MLRRSSNLAPGYPEAAIAMTRIAEAGFAYNQEFAGTEERYRGVPAQRRVRMILDVAEIQRILPHRYPFLMVDRIVEIERLKRIVGVKNVSINDRTFRTFSGQPIMPEC